MKLFIVGATGRTGHQVIDQALEVDHDVTAFVRAKKTLVPTPHLNIIEGDLLDVDALTVAMQGHDVVISCLGTDRTYNGMLASITKAVTEAMQRSGVKRVIYMASAGVDREIEGIIGKFVTFMIRDELREHRQATDVLKASGLTFTIVRPMQLTDGPRTKKYRTEIDTIPVNARQISRADVAHFILKTAELDKYPNQSVGLAY